MPDTAKVEKASVTRHGIFDLQVCIPEDWDNDQVTKFANKTQECGTSGGWVIRKEGDKYLKGCKERVPCEKREGFVHIMLDA